MSSVDQVALARLLESGDYERHVNRVRVRAREARDGLTSLVRKAFPAGEVSIEHADAGLYCTVVAERGAGGSSFVRALTRSSIPFVDISDCYWCADGAFAPENTNFNPVSHALARTRQKWCRTDWVEIRVFLCL